MTETPPSDAFSWSSDAERERPADWNDRCDAAPELRQASHGPAITADTIPPDELFAVPERGAAGSFAEAERSAHWGETEPFYGPPQQACTVELQVGTDGRLLPARMTFDFGDRMQHRPHEVRALNLAWLAVSQEVQTTRELLDKTTHTVKTISVSELFRVVSARGARTLFDLLTQQNELTDRLAGLTERLDIYNLPFTQMQSGQALVYEGRTAELLFDGLLEGIRLLAIEDSHAAPELAGQRAQELLQRITYRQPDEAAS